MKYPITCLCILLSIWGPGMSARAQAPEILSLEAACRAARQHYPLARQSGLIEKSKGYSLDNAAKGYLPQVSINGQASYQSAVTQIPIRVPGMEVPALSRDQYRLYGEASQVLFDGGMIRQQQEAIAANALVEAQQLEVNLYQLRNRIQQLFFGILALDEQLKQNELLQKDIQAGIHTTQGAIANGTALKSSGQVLQAELLKAEQHRTTLRASRKAYTDMLALFVHLPLNEKTALVKPAPIPLSVDISRPELQLFAYQRKSLDIQDKGIAVRQQPRVNLFLQSGIGRPALNLLSNDLEPYAIGGIRINWSLAGFYTGKNESALLAVNRKHIDLQQETFLFNTQLAIKQQQAEIARLQELLLSDEAIIALRASIRQAAAAQLANGVILAHDYVREVNAEDQARQMKIVHEIQWLMAQYQLQTTTGQ